MLSRPMALSPSRFVVIALAMTLAVTLRFPTPAAAQAQYTCRPGHYDVIVPGYVGVPASVDVQCSGSITTMDVQWPFDDPSPEAWHNHYELNTADMTVSITVGGEWLCTLQWIPNNGGTTRYLIAGCPEMYGGNGTPVAWSDPCIQKVRNRIYPDFWIFKNVVAQNGGAGLRVMSRMVSGFAQGAGAPDAGTGENPGQPAADPGTSVEPDVQPIGIDGPEPMPRAPRTTPPSDPVLDLPPANPLAPPDTDLLKQLERRPPARA